MKNRIALLIIILGFSLKVFSVENKTQKDTLLYFELDVRSETKYPVVMCGVTKQLDFSKLSLSDGENFISSFYMQAFFVPNLLIYDEVLRECIRINNDTTLAKYLGQGQKLMNLIAGNGRETKLILNNGDNVFIRITEIKGVFLQCSKKYVQLPTLSIEYPVNEVKEIDKLYIPLNITDYRKPSRKCIKEMIK